MKALTLHQPWASLIACGFKTIETRSWPIVLRDDKPVQLAIHAANRVPGYAYDALAANDELLTACHVPPMPPLGKWPLGAVVAVCEVVACLPSVRDDGEEWAAPVFEDNRAFGDFSLGRWLWLLDKIERMPIPLPAVGHQGLWDWNV